MDELFYIQEQMETLDPIDTMDYFMYETGVKKSPVWDKNQGILINVVNLLRRLIDRCITLIKNILSSSKNLIDFIFLSKEDKERYQKYCAYIKSHPGSGKKKVTVRDWKKVEAHYNDALKRANALAVKVANKQISQEEAKKEEKDIMDSIMNVGTKCSAIVTVDMALNLAAGSITSAKEIQETLFRNQSFMEALRREIGDKDVAKFQKKVNDMTKETYFRKLKSAILGKKQKDLAESMHDMLKQVQNSGSFMGKVGLANTHKTGLMLTGKQMIKDKEFRKDAIRVGKKGKETYDKAQPHIQALKSLKEEILG